MWLDLMKSMKLTSSIPYLETSFRQTSMISKYFISRGLSILPADEGKLARRCYNHQRCACSVMIEVVRVEVIAPLEFSRCLVRGRNGRYHCERLA